MPNELFRGWSSGWTGATTIGSRPVLVVNPRRDDDFVRLAARLVDAGASSSEELQHALRARYPRTVVRERSLSNEPMPMWYVYREGRWVSGLSD